ncbi:CPBP family intramembrane glutamic endopeptidase [Staphylococcus simulans]|uniref:CPBP family intramembrane glutamic endopeptidase n=1 Tax=Staphylococcus simulans TaxID=1286 RepID=UPI000E68C0A6|nr:CPBP family intramembrane glutamic endopeptidase [Staphylococcus simulans]RIN74173.1 CPBP family intramembrane metalloprotease [Staphylococcus simulans]
MEFKNNKPAWRDLTLIPIGFVLIFLFTFLETLIAANFNVPMTFETLIPISAIGQINTYIAILIIYYYFHYSEMPMKLSSGWHYVKKHWLFLLIMLLIAMGGETLYNHLITFLPENLQYTETQNEQELELLFRNPAFLPFTFIFVVIVGPVVEELFFRTILIGELGKKLNYIVMAIISVIGFALIHVTGAESPFEIGAYLIMAIVIVYVYFKSGKNTGATIAIHIANNLISFLITIFYM